MNRKVKIAGFIAIIAAAYYGLQYASSAVHYNCAILKDDCPPPIYGAAELVYRVMVQPPWLEPFEVKPVTYSFDDGRFGFWGGKVNGSIVVIRVPEDGSPVLQWIFEERLPGKIPISPATGEHVAQWLNEHPEHPLLSVPATER